MSGRVSLLMGQGRLKLFPIETRRAGGLALFRSKFGTEGVAPGNTERV